MGEIVIGIIGGMGPEATLYAFEKIISATPAKKDQEHLRVVIDSNPKIPDRTEAFLSGDSEAIVEALSQTARNLERAGASLLIIPCNSAHIYFKRLTRHFRLPFLHIVDEVGKEAARHGFKSLGLLASKGVIQSRLYQQRLQNFGFIIPTKADCDLVHQAIYKIKAGEKDEAFGMLLPVAKSLGNSGAEAIILGCTEIPLVLKEEKIGLPLLDSVSILARAAVKIALSRREEGRGLK